LKEAGEVPAVIGGSTRAWAELRTFSSRGDIFLEAPFPAETASLTRNQVLQQAGMAMLAQANALPNSVLALLR